MTRLASFMVRDPFDAAVELPRNERMHAALARCIPEELRERRVGIITNRATDPKSVIDAMPDRNCCRCGEAVWSSPSSKRVEDGVYVCTRCLAEEIIKS